MSDQHKINIRNHNAIRLIALCAANLMSLSSTAETLSGLIIGVPGESIVSSSTTAHTAGAFHLLRGSSSGIVASEDQFWSQDSPGIQGDSETDDQFARVLVTGDFNGDKITDLAVGTPNETGAAGAVNVIYGSGDMLTATGNQLWTQASPGIQGAAEGLDQFGFALTACDFNGDAITDLAIGAPTETVSNTQAAGAVNILYGSTQGLTAAGNQLLVDSTFSDGVEQSDLFGFALAADNFNADSYCDLVVGIPGEDPGRAGWYGNSNGAIAVWYGSSNGLVKPPAGTEVIHRGFPGLPGNPGDEAFGSALATGDFNGDTYPDLAIGSPKADYGTANVGEVDILYGSATGFFSAGSPSPIVLRQDLIGSASPELADEFGSVLSTGDVNGDGYDDLAIGIPLEDIEKIYNAGIVQILYGSPAGITFKDNQIISQKISSIKGWSEDYDLFGSALALGDINGDGYDDLAIGVPGESIGSILGAGAVNVVYGSSSGITTVGNQLLGQHWLSIIDSAETSDHFGSALVMFPHTTTKK